MPLSGRSQALSGHGQGGTWTKEKEVDPMRKFLAILLTLALLIPMGAAANMRRRPFCL